MITKKSRLVSEAAFHFLDSVRAAYSVLTGAFSAGVVVAAVLAPFFMQHEGMVAVPADAWAQCDFASAVQASFFLPFLPSLSPSWAKAVVPAKANRARASRVFFMLRGA